MRVVVVHAPGRNIQEMRRGLSGAGLDCAAEDCVVWDQLAFRLAQSDVDLLVLDIEDIEAVDWQSVREAGALTSAPKLAVGPAHNGAGARQAREHGVMKYVDRTDLQTGLETALDDLRQAGAMLPKRGAVVSVLSPTSGSGGTTVASNLAASLARNGEVSVGLAELSRDPRDLALLLNLERGHTVGDVCRRWQGLDAVGLKSSFTPHRSGMRVLAHGPDFAGSETFHRDSVRRITVLLRVVFDFGIIALGSQVGEEEIEVMRLSDTILMVLTPNVPAVRRAQWACQTAVDAGIPREHIQPVVNRWGQRGQLKARDIEQSLKMKPIQYIPDDPGRANRAANEGRLLQELSRTARITRRFAALAAVLNGSAAKKTKKSQRKDGVSR